MPHGLDRLAEKKESYSSAGDLFRFRLLRQSAAPERISIAREAAFTFKAARRRIRRASSRHGGLIPAAS